MTHQTNCELKNMGALWEAIKHTLRDQKFYKERSLMNSMAFSFFF